MYIYIYLFIYLYFYNIVKYQNVFLIKKCIISVLLICQNKRETCNANLKLNLNVNI